MQGGRVHFRHDNLESRSLPLLSCRQAWLKLASQNPNPNNQILVRPSPNGTTAWRPSRAYLVNEVIAQFIAAPFTNVTQTIGV